MKKFLSHFTKSRKIAEIGKMKYWNSENTTQIKSDIREMKNLRALNFLFKEFKAHTQINLAKNAFSYLLVVAVFTIGYFLFSFLCILTDNVTFEKIGLITINIFYFLLMSEVMLSSYYSESKREVMRYVDDIVYKKSLVEALQKSAMHFEKETLIEVVDTHKSENRLEPSLKRKRL